MSQLNLKQILVTNNLSEVVEYVNYNFEQIVLNGGGPKGTTGLIGPPGVPGKPGEKGLSGATGDTGTRVFVGAYNPGTTSVSPSPRDGDVFLDAESTFINIYEFGGTGTWSLVQTVSAPSSSWKSAKDFVATTPDKAVIYNDVAIADRFLIGPSAYIGPSAAGGTSLSGPILDYSGGTGTAKLSSHVSSGLGPLSFSNTIATIVGVGNQIRLINPISGVISGTGGTYSQFNVDGGGVIFSLTGSTGGTSGNQALEIFNADLTGNKAFGVRLNGANYSIFADKSNRISLGGSAVTTLFNTLSVAGGAVFGTSFFGSALGTTDSVAVAGRISVGTTQTSSANLSVYHSLAGSTAMMYLDLPNPVSVGNISKSQFILGAGYVSDIVSSSNNANYYALKTDITRDSGEAPAYTDQFRILYKNFVNGAAVHNILTVSGASGGAEETAQHFTTTATSILVTRLSVGQSSAPTANLDVGPCGKNAASFRLRPSDESIKPVFSNVGDFFFSGDAIQIYTNSGWRTFTLV